MKKAILGALFAGAMLASCSSDEPLVNGGEDNKGGDRFISINICQPGGVSTRATDDDFEDGTLYESAAAKGTFLFFKDGVSTQVPQTKALTWGSGDDTHKIEKISNTVVVIAGNERPNQCLVILNAPDSIITKVSNKGLNDVKALVNSYAVCESVSGKQTNFLMTNSAYWESKDGSNKQVLATDITGHVFSTKAEAEKNENAVDIYVERVAVKVTTKKGDKFNSESTTIAIGSADNVLTPHIEGIEIANIANQTYLYKHISDSWLTDWSDVSAPNYYRSYWAVMPENVTYENKSWTNITDNYENEQTYYIRENTGNTKTAVLVTATLKDAKNNAVTFLQWGGNYYKKEGFLKQLATNLTNKGFKIQTTETVDSEEKKTISDIKETDLAWLSNDQHKDSVAANKLKGYQMAAYFKTTLTNNQKIYKDDTESSVDAINAALMENSNIVWIWESGKCYYYVPIEHFSTVDGYKEGVVRNHVYKLALDGIKGLGTPVYNPDEIIIPEKPKDDLFYMSAKINILKWRVVNQSVVFQ